MEKFESGNKVKVVRLDVTKPDYVSDLNQYLGRTGTIHDTQFFGSELLVEFDDGNSWWFYPDWLELVEKKKKGWTGKIVVIDAPKLSPPFDSYRYEPGIVYTVKAGSIQVLPWFSKKPLQNSTFEDIRDWFSRRAVKVIEFKGFCKNGKE